MTWLRKDLSRDWQLGALATMLVHGALLVAVFVRLYPAHPAPPVPPSLSVEMFDAPPAPVVKPKFAPSKPEKQRQPEPESLPNIKPLPRGSDTLPPVAPPNVKTAPPQPSTTPVPPPPPPPPASAALQAPKNRLAADTSENSNARETWESAVVAKLEGAKRYPAAARFARQQAIVYARFIVDRQGKVLQADLVKSSGFPELDREVRALFARVRLPPPPVTIPDQALTMVVPIEFTLDS